jgi:hypothetical protein
MKDTKVDVEENSQEAIVNIPNDENKETNEEIKWKHFECVLNNFLFVTFFVFVLLISLVLFITWGANYTI